MSASETGTVRPGFSVGSTSEFSLFFHVKPGEGEGLRAALRELQGTPGYRPGDYGMAIATIHEARFVLFDDDTRLAFITSFDGPWDAYMEDFFTSGPTLALFDVIFRHVEGYEGLPDLAAVRAFVLGAQVTAAAYARNYGGTVKEIRKSLRVNDAFQRVLDDPEAGEALQHPALKPLLDEAADQLGAGDEEEAMSDHISGPRALAEPIADITDVYAFASPERQGHLGLVQNTLPFAQPSAQFSDGLVYRFRLRPLAAGGPNDPAPFAVAEEEFVFDCVFSDPAAGDGALRQEGACSTPAGDMVSFRVGDEQGGAGHGLRV